MEFPTYSESLLPIEDQTRSDTENFLVCTVEMRNQLGVLLENPGLPWL